jgi:6-phosphogluconolactonase
MTSPASSPARPTLSVVASASTLGSTAAQFVVARLGPAIRERGVAHWCTTGGSSAPGIYRALRSAPLCDELDWSGIHTWWGDDRFVPAGRALSNVTECEVLLRRPGAGLAVPLAIPDENMHPIPVAEIQSAGGGPAEAAAAYEAEMRAQGPAVGADGVPVFDLIILGVGPDGHILSVFPGSDVFDSDAWVVGVPAPERVEPRVPRVTIHPRLLAAARSVLVVTAGESKADVVARAWAGGDPRELPLRATLLPQTTWLLDEAAAAGLPADAR